VGRMVHVVWCLRLVEILIEDRTRCNICVQYVYDGFEGRNDAPSFAFPCLYGPATQHSTHAKCRSMEPGYSQICSGKGSVKLAAWYVLGELT
jgi:hypothetical protein